MRAIARVLSRVAVLSLTAGVFVVLTAVYGRSMRPVVPDRQTRAERSHRPSAPDGGRFLEFLGEGLNVTIVALFGRIVFGLRLTPASRSEGQPVLLDLREGAKRAESS
jgi:hypothetical protein